MYRYWIYWNRSRSTYCFFPLVSQLIRYNVKYFKIHICFCSCFFFPRKLIRTRNKRKNKKRSSLEILTSIQFQFAWARIFFFFKILGSISWFRIFVLFNFLWDLVIYYFINCPRLKMKLWKIYLINDLIRKILVNLNYNFRTSIKFEIVNDFINFWKLEFSFYYFLWTLETIWRMVWWISKVEFFFKFDWSKILLRKNSYYNPWEYPCY